MKVYENFSEAYPALATELLNAPEETVRGLKTKEIVGMAFTIKDTRTVFDLAPNRFNYLLAEILWYAAGSSEFQWILPFSSFWKRIANEDALTINSNYGERVYRQTPAGPIAPFFRALRQLRTDLNSRQAIVHINFPGDITAGNKDIPCTLNLQFLVRQNKLHLVVSMRSNDIWKGLTFDAPAFYIFQQTMLDFLRVDHPTLELGEYHHRASSFHVYETDYANIEKASAAALSDVPLVLNQPLITESGRPTLAIRELYTQIEKDPAKISEVYETLFK